MGRHPAPQQLLDCFVFLCVVYFFFFMFHSSAAAQPCSGPPLPPALPPCAELSRSAAVAEYEWGLRLIKAAGGAACCVDREVVTSLVSVSRLPENKVTVLGGFSLHWGSTLQILVKMFAPSTLARPSLLVSPSWPWFGAAQLINGPAHMASSEFRQTIWNCFFFSYSSLLTQMTSSVLVLFTKLHRPDHLTGNI